MIAAGVAGAGAGSAMSGTAGSIGTNLFGGTVPWLTNLFSGMQGLFSIPAAGSAGGSPSGQAAAPAKVEAANATSEVPNASDSSGQGENKEKTKEEKWADFLNGLNALTRPNSIADPKAPSVVVLPAYQGSAFLGRM